MNPLASCQHLDDKLAAQKQIRTIEAQRNQKRRTLFDAQDQVDARRDTLIAGIERRLAQNTLAKRLLTLRWSLR